MFQENISAAPDAGVPISQGWHLWRVEKWEDKESANSPGERTLWFTLICQDEPEVGRPFTYIASRQASALMGLKALYKACEYRPGAEGHDPDKILTATFYGKITWEWYNPESKKHQAYVTGEPTEKEGWMLNGKIAPWHMRSVVQGVPNK